MSSPAVAEDAGSVVAEEPGSAVAEVSEFLIGSGFVVPGEVQSWSCNDSELDLSVRVGGGTSSSSVGWEVTPSDVAEHPGTVLAHSNLPPGCVPGNQTFPRDIVNIPLSFDVQTPPDLTKTKKEVHKAASNALKHMRELADPNRCGILNYYVMDLTEAGIIEVRVPKRYPKKVLMTFPPEVRSAIGAQYYYKDADGNSVVTERVAFSPKEFVQYLVRFGAVGLKPPEEVVGFEWRTWSMSNDDTMEKNNLVCADLDLWPRVKLFEYHPCQCDFVLYLSGKREPVRIHSPQMEHAHAHL